MQTLEEVIGQPPQTLMPAYSAADEEAFQHAVSAQKQRELGAAFAHRCLTVLLWLAGALVLSVGLNGYLGWKVANPPIKYFTTENGRVIPIEPTDKPAFSDLDVAAYGANKLRESFTLDFVHFRDQINAQQDGYSEEGFAGYNKALVTSNVLGLIRDQRMNLSVEVGPGVIHAKGKIGEIYTWEYQYPVTLKLDGQQTSSPAQRFIFTLRIQRTDVQVKPKGLEVTQVISTGAN
jgi:intracellular multiplication protein IcmL